MKNDETSQARSQRIIAQLQKKYPNTKCFDLDGRGLHFLSEVKPTQDHPEYDLAVEVIILSKPHKHKKTTQKYTIMSGDIELHVDDEVVHLFPGNEYTIAPGVVHWAKSENESWVEIYSTPGWTAEDHITV